ncbi:MAG: T9SS type A sorting domain-containing protein [Flavobacterium sp.]|nr:T9SS type A sorting domain-containing protein [Flavobacterium sp.]
MKNILLLFTALINLSVFGQIGYTTTYTGIPNSACCINGNLNVATLSPAHIVKDADNNLYVSQFNVNSVTIRKISTNGIVSSISNSPRLISDMAYDSTTNSLLVSSYFPYIDNNNVLNRDYKVSRLDLNGNQIGIIYSSLNGEEATGVAVDNLGNVYYTLTDNVIKKFVPSTSTTTTYAGIQGASGGTNGSLLSATFSYPRDLEIDSSGNLYCISGNNLTVRKISSSEVSTVTTLSEAITDMYLDGNNLYFSFNHNIKYFSLTTSTMNNLSGSSSAGFLNGNPSTTKFDNPIGIVKIGDALLVCDYGNDVIRKIELTENCLGVVQTLTANSGTINIGTITGTIPASPVCYSFSQANPNANWWSFTPTQNGLLDITTITPQNATTVDTRLSIFTGTCSALTCFSGNDNVSTTDLRSTINDLILTAGTTYYFVFDDKVSDNAAVNFFYEFTPQTCFRPNTVTFGTPTENTINVNWTAPTVGNTNPSSYTIQIGPRDYGVDSSAALQTIPSLVANSTTITGLTSNTVYDIYIKSNCSASDSSVWYGPFRSATEFTAVTPTYTENFDSDVSFLYVGWNRSGGTNSTLWRTYTGSTPFVNSGTRSIYSPIEPTLNTPTNTYAYTRKLNLTAGQSYTVSFMARQVLSSGTTTSRSLQVSYTSNSDYTNPATHNQIVNLTNTSDLGYFSENHNFTVSNSGQYRIAFRNAFQRTTGTGTAWLMLDSVVVSTALSVNSFSKSSLQLYPNPVLDNITIQNNDNLDIENISIVDLNGRVVKEFKYTDLNNNLINISELEKGVYIINLITSNQEVLSKKIIKE